FTIRVNLVAGAGKMKVDDALQRGIKPLPNQIKSLGPPRQIVAITEVLPNCLNKPERRIDGVVLRRLTLVWESIRQHAAVDVFEELKKYLFCGLRLLSR